MRLLVVCSLCCLTLTDAAASPSDTLGLDDQKSNTETMFAKPDKRDISQKFSENTDNKLNDKNDTTSRREKPKNTHTETADKENTAYHQRYDEMNPLQTTVHEEKFNHRKNKRENKEPSHKSEENSNIERDSTNFLQTYYNLKPKQHPLLHKKHPLFSAKKPVRILLHHKSISPMFHSTILGSPQQSEHEDSPESLLLQILFENQNGNIDSFKNVELRKTVAYNISNLVDANKQNNFQLEKKENLTVEKGYLDSQERETKYSETHSSKIHKSLGPKIFFDDESIKKNSENTHEKNINEIDDLNNSNVDFAHNFVGTVKCSKDNSLTPDYLQRIPSEFVSGSFVGSDFPTYSNVDRAYENESDWDLLGQPNDVNKIYPMPGVTMNDFEILIEKSILEKSNTESPKVTLVQGSEDKMYALDGIEKSNSEDVGFSNHQTVETRTEEILNTQDPEHILKSNPTSENPETKDFTEPWSQNGDTILGLEGTLSSGNDTTHLIIKHGNSIVLDANGVDVTEISVEIDKNEANTDIPNSDNIYNFQEIETEYKTGETTTKKYEKEIAKITTQSNDARVIGKQSSLNQLLEAREPFVETESSEEESEDDFSDKYTPSILVTNLQTEEASVTEIIVTKGVTASKISEDTNRINIRHFNKNFSNNILQETPEDFRETSINKDQTLGPYLTVLNPKEGKSNSYDKSDQVESDESRDDKYIQPKTTDTIYKDQYNRETTTETLTQTLYTHHTPASENIQSINDQISTDGISKYKLTSEEVEESSEEDNDVAGQYSNLDPIKIKPDNIHSTPFLRRGDMDILESTLDSEIEVQDTTPLHVVELFAGQGQGKGQEVNGNKEMVNLKTISDDYNNVISEAATDEPLTELCFPLLNENEATLWDLLSGKLYLESEGKKIPLKMKGSPLRRCNSGTRKCKLSFGFEDTNETIKEKSSWEDFDETDGNIANVNKRSVMEDENVDNKRKEVEVMPSTVQNTSNEDQREISVLREKSRIKEFLLTNLMLMLLTNDTSSNIKSKNCGLALKSAANTTHPGLKIKEAHLITEGEDNTQPTSNPISFLNKIGEDNLQDNKIPNSRSSNESSGERFKRTLISDQKDLNQAKVEGCGCGSMLDSEGQKNVKRFKRALVHQKDIIQEKEGGCGCGSMLGRTLPPIPNHDHFLGKRLNIITSIAHAIKDLAIERPIY